jgi:pyruvate dehydrogenase E1 component alpha subunit
MTERLNTTQLDRYRRMLGMRAFELSCLAGFSAREIHGELHLGIGQEAVAAGIAEHLRPEDAVVSTHRNHLHALAKGVDPRGLMAEIFERETGICRGRGGHMHPFDPTTNFSATGIVGSSLPVALGYAYAFAMEGGTRVAVAATGDGGTNAGAFHECLNMAGAWKLPLVVLVENNEWAISVRSANVIATETIAERAVSYRAWGERVDGRDADVVAEAFGRAVNHARSGNGPAVLEAMCDRFRGHYEGDADTYRPRDERVRMRDNDPLARARAKLVEAGFADAELDAAKEEADAQMAAILAAVRSDPLPAAQGVLDHVFAERALP